MLTLKQASSWCWVPVQKLPNRQRRLYEIIYHRDVSEIGNKLHGCASRGGSFQNTEFLYDINWINRGYQDIEIQFKIPSFGIITFLQLHLIDRLLCNRFTT